MTLGTIGATHYPEIEGTYQMVCKGTNGWPIYKKENSSEILEFITDGSSFAIWYVTVKASYPSLSKILKPVTVPGQCLGPDTSSNWFVSLVSLCFKHYLLTKWSSREWKAQVSINCRLK